MDICLPVNVLVFLVGQGPLIAFVTQLLKRIPFVKERPLVVAAVLNLAVTLLTGATVCGHDVARILEQLAAGFAGSVASYEVAKRAIKRPEEQDNWVWPDRE